MLSLTELKDTFFLLTWQIFSSISSIFSAKIKRFYYKKMLAEQPSIILTRFQ